MKGDDITTKCLKVLEVFRTLNGVESGPITTILIITKLSLQKGSSLFIDFTQKTYLEEKLHPQSSIVRVTN